MDWTDSGFQAAPAARDGSDILLIEPFYGGSHKQLMDILGEELGSRAVLWSTADKKWQWKARTSALYFSQIIPKSQSYRFLFTSSVLNLAELVALRPDLARLKTIIYFHENQLVYPTQEDKERDFQYGYNQILSAQVADLNLFNSKEWRTRSFFCVASTEHTLMVNLCTEYGLNRLILSSFGAEEIFRRNMNTPSTLQLYVRLVKDATAVLKFNMTTFLDGIRKFLSRIPTPRPDDRFVDNLRKKCRVVHFPLCLPHLERRYTNKFTALNRCISFARVQDSRQPGDREFLPDVCRKSCSPVNHDVRPPLHIIWPHRWEHDKNPDFFITVLEDLRAEGLPFYVSFVGQTYSEIPGSLIHAGLSFSNNVRYFGYEQSKTNYYDALKSADLVISTAQHEFFGVSMLEAVYFGCYPLVPARLVYPEIYPEKYLYDGSKPSNLTKIMRSFCVDPGLIRDQNIEVDISRFFWKNLKQSFMCLFD